MNAHSARRSHGLALWLALASFAIIAIAAYAREHAAQPNTAYIAVRVHGARPPSVRLASAPAPAAAVPGEAPDLRSSAVHRIDDGAGVLDDASPRPALLRHEYPRGPPRA